MSNTDSSTCQGKRQRVRWLGQAQEIKGEDEEALELTFFRGFFFFLARHEQEEIFVNIGKIAREKNFSRLMQGAVLHVMREIMQPTDDVIYETLSKTASLAHASQTLEVMFKVFRDFPLHLPRSENKIRLISCLLQNADSNCFYLEKQLLSDQPPPIFEEDIVFAVTSVQNPIIVRILLFHYIGTFPRGLVRRVVAAKNWPSLQVLLTDTPLSRDPHFQEEWAVAFDQALVDKEHAFLQIFLCSSLGTRLEKQQLSDLISSAPSSLVEVGVGRGLAELTSKPVRFQEILWAVSKKGHKSSVNLLVNSFPKAFQASSTFTTLGWRKFLFACLLLVGEAGGVLDVVEGMADFCFEVALENLTFFDLALVGGSVLTLRRVVETGIRRRAQEYIHSLLKQQNHQAKLVRTFLWMVVRDSHESFEFVFLLCKAPAQTWVSLAQRLIDQSLTNNAPKTYLWACSLVSTYGDDLNNGLFFKKIVSRCLRRPQYLWALQIFCSRILPSIQSWQWDFLIPLFAQLWHENTFAGTTPRRHFRDVVDLLCKNSVFPLDLEYKERRMLQTVSSVPNKDDREYFCLCFIEAHKSFEKVLCPVLRDDVEDFVIRELRNNHSFIAWKILSALPKDEACLVILRGPIFHVTCCLGEADFLQKLLGLTSSRLSGGSLYKLMLMVCHHTRGASMETDQKKKKTLMCLASEWRLRQHKGSYLVDASEMMEKAARASYWHVLEFISSNDLFTFNLPCGDHFYIQENPLADRPLVYQNFRKNLTKKLCTQLTLFFATLPTPHFDFLQFDTVIEIVIQYSFSSL